MRFCLTIIFFIGFSNPTFSQKSIKFITYNIRYDNPNDGKDIWDNRKEGLGSFLAEEDADFIGMQEVLQNQLEFIKEFLTDHKHLGVGRDDGASKGEYSPILYNSERWELLENKNKWLSSTPDEVSRGWDAACNRVVTFGLFKNKESGDTIAVFNTHFDHKGQVARENSAKLLVGWIDEFAQVKTKILMGDFNLIPEDPLYDILTSKLMDSRNIANHKYEDYIGTSNGFQIKGPFENRIDYIFVAEGVEVLSYENAALMINGRHMSDHFPLIVQLNN